MGKQVQRSSLVLTLVRKHVQRLCSCGANHMANCLHPWIWAHLAIHESIHAFFGFVYGFLPAWAGVLPMVSGTGLAVWQAVKAWQWKSCC